MQKLSETMETETETLIGEGVKFQRIRRITGQDGL